MSDLKKNSSTWFSSGSMNLWQLIARACNFYEQISKEFEVVSHLLTKGWPRKQNGRRRNKTEKEKKKKKKKQKKKKTTYSYVVNLYPACLLLSFFQTDSMLPQGVYLCISIVNRILCLLKLEFTWRFFNLYKINVQLVQGNKLNARLF